MTVVAEVLGAIPPPPADRIEMGWFTFRFYGLSIAIGVIVGVEVARKRWRRRGGDPDDVIEIAKWAVLAGLVGSRMYHVLTDWQAYQGRWIEALYIWQGGLGIPGGLLAGMLVGWWVTRRNGWDVAGVLHACIPGIPIAQAIGRVGNWFNQEVYGGPTDLPWGLRVDGVEGLVHPTFLYEGLWNLALAAALIAADNRGWLRRGQMLPAWIGGYGLGRFWVESIRADAASELLGIRVNHWVSGVAIVVGLAGMFALRSAPRFPPEASLEEEEPTEAESGWIS